MFCFFFATQQPKPHNSLSNPTRASLRLVNMHTKTLMRGLTLCLGVAVRASIFTDTVSVNMLRRSYDYIVVGGGAAGCPLAKTLADGGKSVLLIERGQTRTTHPLTHDLYGAGLVVDDREVSQPIYTEDGVISHIGNVLGGGSSIDMGIQIAETNDYFDYVEEVSGETIDRNLWQAASVKTDTWRFPMPPVGTFTSSYKQALADLAQCPVDSYKKYLAKDQVWSGLTIFDSRRGMARLATDSILNPKPASLDVLVEHEVTRVRIRDGRAECVNFVKAPTKPDPVGKFVARSPTNERRVCASTIILSAGAVLSPDILFKSGVGPRDTIRELGVNLVHEIDALGRNTYDRVLHPVVTYDKLYSNASIASVLGMSARGTECDEYTPFTRKDCHMIPTEELGGGRDAEGVLLATRFILPPRFRDTFIADRVISLLRNCSKNNHNLLCRMLEPVRECFGRMRAIFYFTSEIHSRGKITYDNGRLSVRANYLQDPKDYQQAIAGSQLLSDVIRSGRLDDHAELDGNNSCPMKMFSALNLVIGGFGVDLPIADGGKKIATFPPVLPSSDPEAFVNTYMSSIWHWGGSAALGSVVDSNFNVNGISSLKIVDASVLPVMTRMNPLSELITLGYYAGEKILQEN